MTASFQKIDFLSERELEQVLDFYDSLPYSPEYSSPKNQRKLMHYDSPDYPLMRSIFEPKIQKILPGGRVVNSTFTDWTTPVEVHTDSWQPNEDRKNQQLGYAVLVPLRVDPENVVAQTVVFDQYNNGPTNTLEDIDSDAVWNIAEQNREIHGLVEQELDQKVFEEHLTHCDYEKIKHFSIQGIYNWFAGSAIVWHRKHYHTSSSFIEVNSKLHAIFLVNF